MSAPRAFSFGWKLRVLNSERRLRSSTASRSATARANAPKRFPRYVPQNAKDFMKKDGELVTTQANADFFAAHARLDPDNGKMCHLNGGPELHKLASSYAIVVLFSPQHIIHPFDLTYFDPRGHSIAPKIREKYARKTSQESLWVMAMTRGTSTSAVVRQLIPRRMKSALYKALVALGYDVNGSGETRQITGTLSVILHNAVKAAALDPAQFGKVVAATLHNGYSQSKTNSKKL